MNRLAQEEWNSLAEELRSADDGVRCEVALFPSGGAMLDVQRSDGHTFGMAFTQEHGFTVDELQADDGFTTAYRFTFSDFQSAARKLRELVAGETLQHKVSQPQLSLVVVYARDLEAAHDFYASLGVSLQAEQHGSGPRHYAATLGGTVFEIYPQLSGEHPGAVRIGFQVASVDGLVQQLRQRQVAVLTEPRDSPWGRRAVVQDPDGNRVELTQKLVSVAS